MVSILLATHGKFAEGIFMSGNMIFGEQENVSAVILLPSEGPDDLCAKMEKAISEFDDQEQVLILVDLWGGTPFNQANRLIAGHEDNWAIVAGLNLPMLVAAYAARDDYETAHELAQAIIPEGKTGIRVFPKDLEPAEEGGAAAAAGPAAPAGAIPPGTVLGDGHIKIAFARIDTRLLHGQVAVAWTNYYKADVILIANNAMLQDKAMQVAFKLATPPGVTLSMKSLDGAAAVINNPKHASRTIMVITKTMKDAEYVIGKTGDAVKEVLMGGLRSGAGKKQIDMNSYMGEEDIAVMNRLEGQGIHLFMQADPTSKKLSCEDIRRNYNR